MNLHLIHLVLVSLWGGFVLAESIIELGARTEERLRNLAVAHFWMDLLGELPLIIGVLITGIFLSLHQRPLSSLHLLKIGAGLMAIVLNLFCILQVILRYKKPTDLASLHLRTHRVHLSATLGIPFGLLAAYLGLAYFMR